ncbi:MAG: DUF4252 domain-containing protein [Methanoregulaceae archaeon]|nr:DUF4252 domain-containing protein [Methanoregulaceae archaeon]
MNARHFWPAKVLKGKLAILCAFLFLSASVSFAEEDLKLQGISKLASSSEEVVEVNLNAKLLQSAGKLFSGNDSAAKSIVSGLQGIYVRTFTFSETGRYQGDIDAFRSQFKSPAWIKIVGVKSKADTENVDIFTKMEGDKISGLSIIAQEPKELTIVVILGAIDIDKLSQLEGKFGIPVLPLETKTGPKPK